MLGKITIFPIILSIDSDNDGLCDYIEEYITLTNILLIDTDNDGLSDYDEIYLCNTNPLTKDTDNTGLIDAKKDTDNDGLNNLEELELRTNPLNEDTDEDGLFDYDEKYKYFTDPLSPDSDGDELLDGQEIVMNLNPLSIKTNDVDDCDYIFEQDVLLNSDKLKPINENSKDFQISLKIKTNGYVENVFNISHSSMNSFFTQDYIVENSLIDIEYLEKYNIEYNEIKYCILDSPIDNFAIFKYFEDTNMLLPIETKYDYVNNIISFKEINTSSISTYCIVNLDMFINSEVSSNTFQFNSVGSELTSSQSLQVFFIINTYYSNNVLDYYKEQIIETAQKLFKKNNNASVYISILNSEFGESCTTIAEVESVLNNINSTTHLGIFEDNGIIYNNVVENFSNTIINKLDNNSKKYCFVFTSGDSNNIFSMFTNNIPLEINNLKNNNVNTSIVTNYDNTSFYSIENKSLAEFATNTFGIHFGNVINKDVSSLIVSHIYNDITFGSNNIVSYYTGLGNIEINSLSLTYKDLFELYKSKDTLGLDIDFSIYPDTDGDGVPDFAEINMDLISFDNNGNIILPSFKDCCYYSSNNSGYEWFKEQLNSLYGEDFFQNNMLAIVPTLSNPVLVDSDGDGLLDINDPYPNEKFDDRFLLVDDFDYIPTVDFVEQHFAYGQKCYDTKISTDGSFYELRLFAFFKALALTGDITIAIPNIFEKEQIKNFERHPTPNFSKFLNYYLKAQPSTIQEISSNDMYIIINGQKSNKEHYSYNINQLKNAVEQVVTKKNDINNPICIASNNENNFKITCYKGTNCENANHSYVYDDVTAVDWGYAIGESLGGMVGQAYMFNDTYYMKINYYLIDTYEFPIHWSISDANDWLNNIAHDIHEYGYASEYKIIGVYEDFVSWKKGDVLYYEDYKNIKLDKLAYDAPPIS